MAKKKVSVVIMDLDNTLWDWVEIWFQSFDAMLKCLVRKTGIPQEELEAEFREIHQKYGTSEYAFSLEELPSLVKRHPGENVVAVYHECIREYRDARKKALVLYPQVQETLQALKRRGCLLVGYTESMRFYSLYRARKTGLDGLLDHLYTSPEHPLPEEVERRFGSDTYELRRTEHRETPKGELKPNPALLKDIIKDVGSITEECIYVGDSLMKDVMMAQAAGVTDVYAKYGKSHARPEYALLRRVTHWPDEQVDKERRITEDQVKPSYTLTRSLDELLEMFDFEEFRREPPEKLQAIIEIWKQTVDVQQHFNDLEMRVRNYAITVLVAVLGATAFALKEVMTIRLFDRVFPFASGLLLIGLIGWLAFYFMDRFWYHRLLYGAVKQGQFIEDRVRGSLPEIALTRTIGDESPLRIQGWKIRSTRKIDVFYLAIGFLLVILALVLPFTQRAANA